MITVIMNNVAQSFGTCIINSCSSSLNDCSQLKSEVHLVTELYYCASLDCRNHVEKWHALMWNKTLQCDSVGNSAVQSNTVNKY